ncbi:MAG: SDR family NAD(P)-dependent oxidoreductase [Proteobacteria bacterium]|nr:SDR family NAD(P)-dependent oxidoreductase [Pseudomonadota bacterium]
MFGLNALVVGATSSLAQAMCHALAARGYGLVLAGRDEMELDILARDIAIRHDITCKKLVVDFLASGFSAEDFVAQAGDISHMIMVAGDMGSADVTSIGNLAYTMHLNYTIPAQISTAAAKKLAERFREQKRRGAVVIVSSVAGDRGRQSNYAYGAAKAAISTFASGLRNKFFKQGVHVLTIKPGFIDTPMTWGMQSPLLASREKVAADILKAMEKGRDVAYVPFFWRYIMLIIIHIPEKVFKRFSL